MRPIREVVYHALAEEGYVVNYDQRMTEENPLLVMHPETGEAWLVPVKNAKEDTCPETP